MVGVQKGSCPYDVVKVRTPLKPATGYTVDRNWFSFLLARLVFFLLT